MALAKVTYTGNGTTTNYNIPFTYISTDYIKVYVDGSLTTNYTFPNGNTLQFNTAPLTGVSILIKRETPVDNPLVTFVDGSTLTQEQLNTAVKQTFNVVQESYDALESVSGFDDSMATLQAALASAEAASLAAVEAATDAQAAVGAITFPIPVTNGGTGATSATGARVALGLGSAATVDVGTTANKVVQLDASAKLPAVDGSSLINLPAQLPSQTSNSGKYLTTNGSTPSWASVKTGWTLGTPVATTSGTAVTFTGIPESASVIRLMLHDVSSTAGSATVQLRTGAGSIDSTTTYSRWSDDIAYAAADVIGLGTATNIKSALVTLVLQNKTANRWQIIIDGGVSTVCYTKTISGALDRVSLILSAGTFDSGEVGIMYQ